MNTDMAAHTGVVVITWPTDTVAHWARDQGNHERPAVVRDDSPYNLSHFSRERLLCVAPHGFGARTWRRER